MFGIAKWKQTLLSHLLRKRAELCVGDAAGAVGICEIPNFRGIPSHFQRYFRRWSEQNDQNAAGRAMDK
jgi:hypothetical protein